MQRSSPARERPSGFRLRRARNEEAAQCHPGTALQVMHCLPNVSHALKHPHAAHRH